MPTIDLTETERPALANTRDLARPDRTALGDKLTWAARIDARQIVGVGECFSAGFCPTVTHPQ
jgi:hypothetical protein